MSCVDNYITKEPQSYITKKQPTISYDSKYSVMWFIKLNSWRQWRRKQFVSIGGMGEGARLIIRNLDKQTKKMNSQNHNLFFGGGGIIPIAPSFNIAINITLLEKTWGKLAPLCCYVPDG